MKSFIWIIYIFSGLVFCQDLVFYNNQDTIQFKEGDLININGIKYQYLGANQNEKQIQILKRGLSNFAGTIETLDIYEIKSFGKYNGRFQLKNILKKTCYGFCIVTAVPVIGLSVWNFSTSSNKSIQSILDNVYYSFIGLFVNSIYGITIGAPTGFVYGCVENKLDKMLNKYEFRLKFDQN